MFQYSLTNLGGVNQRRKRTHPSSLAMFQYSLTNLGGVNELEATRLLSRKENVSVFSNESWWGEPMATSTKKRDIAGFSIL